MSDTLLIILVILVLVVPLLALWYLVRKQAKKTEKKKRPKHIAWTILFCIVLYFFDAIYTGLPVFGVFFCLIMILVNFITVLKLWRRDRTNAIKSVVKLMMLSLTVGTIFGTFFLNEHIGNTNSKLIIKAVKNYKTTQGVYPDRLEDLVPTFLSKVPRSSFRLSSNKYIYLANNDFHQLIWVKVPPFGRYVYHFETKKWSFVD